MASPEMTTEERLAHLANLLANSPGYHHEVIRPVVPTHCVPFGKVNTVGHNPGPLTIVTFYISHRPDPEQWRQMVRTARESEAERVAASSGEHEATVMVESSDERYRLVAVG